QAHCLQRTRPGPSTGRAIGVDQVTFPDLRRVESWYQTATDGILNLESLLHDNDARLISKRTREELFGMTQEEWRNSSNAKQNDHELSACRALLSVVEGAIRRDLEARVATHGRHHLALQTLVQGARR